MATTREEVVSEGLTLLDEVGLEGLTLRRLAARLGVKAPTLYWHVGNKRELLDLIAERITEEAYGPRGPIPADQAWWEWMHERGLALRAALLAHRDAALVVAGNRPSPATLPAVEAQLASLVEVGFSPRQALLALRSLASYVVGDVLDEQYSRRRAEESQRSCPPGADAGRAEALHRFLGERAPTLAAAMRRPGESPESRFEFGLRALVAGMQAGLAGRAAQETVGTTAR